SRKHAIQVLRHIDLDLRRRRIGEVARLTHAVLEDCWRDRNKLFPGDAGTVRTLERYVITNSMIAVAETGGVPMASAAAVLANEYANYLREVGGFAVSTIRHHRYVSGCFLDHLDSKKVSLRSIQPSDLETYILQAGKRLSRASLQQEIAPLRGFLRFLAMDGRVPHGLDRQIDTPRLYRLEQLPRALPWDTVKALLRSIDTTSAIGSVEIIECFFGDRETARPFCDAPADGHCDDSVHRTPDRRSDRSAPCARSELDGDVFPARQRCHRDGVVLRHVGVQLDSWFCSSILMLMRSR